MTNYKKGQVFIRTISDPYWDYITKGTLCIYLDDSVRDGARLSILGSDDICSPNMEYMQYVCEDIKDLPLLYRLVWT